MSNKTASRSKKSGAEAEEEQSAEREQLRQMALRHVRQYPDPVLRRKAETVTAFDDELVALVDRMSNIMREAMGVGLAAPQLGLLMQVFTYQFEDEEPQMVANPEITWSSDETDVEEEGCLSLGDIRVEVERPVGVKVSGQNLQGENVEFELDGFRARVFQHEIDHLNGVLAFDRAASDQAKRDALAYLRPKP